jgi:hypothetical protein
MELKDTPMTPLQEGIENKKKRGGRRPNAGRKKLYGEVSKTLSIRCPSSKFDELKQLVMRKLEEWKNETEKN